MLLSSLVEKLLSIEVFLLLCWGFQKKFNFFCCLRMAHRIASDDVLVVVLKLGNYAFMHHHT